MKPEQLTREQIAKLADAHVEHYRSMIDRGKAGDPSIRVVECVALREVWSGVRELAASVDFHPAQLNAAMRWEIADAVESGDYDEMLGIDRSEP